MNFEDRVREFLSQHNVAPEAATGEQLMQALTSALRQMQFDAPKTQGSVNCITFLLSFW